MNDLVRRLADDQEIEVIHPPEQTLEAFRAALERGYIHVRFPATRGGTELGLRLDSECSDFSQADLDTGTGHLLLVGDLSLDYVRTRLRANIELPALRGTGCLEPAEQ